jgi:hypothetical protein
VLVQADTSTSIGSQTGTAPKVAATRTTHSSLLKYNPSGSQIWSIR